jgi:TM2 domain-containing membrane protein YozV
MIGLFVLVLSITGIVRMARTRGGSPWLYGLIAAIGWLALGVLTGAILGGIGFQSGVGRLGTTLVATMVPWAYVGLVALYVRFRVGKGTEGPSGSWSCPHCRSLNQGYALKCDSCGEAFTNARAV